MLPELNSLEIGRLRVSVGYSTHKKGRLLSPIEVGALLDRAYSAGASFEDCAKLIKLHSTGIGRFLRILQLPQDLQHLISWGAEKDSIGFSAAVELVRLKNKNEQRTVANAILSKGLKSKEVRQTVQLKMRSGKPIAECLKEILNMRPEIENRYVFIGSVADQSMGDILAAHTQNERDAILRSGIKSLGLQNVSGRLGKQFFTLVGDEHFDASMKKIGKDTIEKRLRSHISETLEKAGSDR